MFRAYAPGAGVEWKGTTRTIKIAMFSTQILQMLHNLSQILRHANTWPENLKSVKSAKPK